MPMPPILDTIDWKSTFEQGIDFEAWLNQAKNDSNREIMEKIHKQQPLSDDVLATLKKIDRPVHVIAIAEGWCGDVVRHAPILQKMADQSDHIHVRYITREDSKEVFVRYLTNGGEAIPKFIFLNDAFVECGNWGPMTQAFRDLISRGKSCDDVATARKIIHDAYYADRERADVVEELAYLFDIAGAQSVE